MFNTRHTEVSFNSLIDQAASKKIIFLYPWSDFRSLFLEKFLRKAEDGILYYLPPKSIASLSEMVRDLIQEFQYAIPAFGQHHIQPLLDSANEAALGEALAVELNRINTPIIFFIDEVDMTRFKENTGEFLSALVHKLDAKHKLALSSNALTCDPWSGFFEAGDAVILEAERNKNDISFNVESKPKPQLEIYGFGKGTAFINGTEVIQWDGMLPRTLFFYLIDTPLVTRDEIFQDFWPQPQVHVKDATDIFHVTKHKVGEVISRRMTDATDFELTQYKQAFYIPSDTVIRHYDVEVFVDSLDRAAHVEEDHQRELLLRRAVELYTAPFLTALSAKWVLRRRDQLAYMYSEALIDLARIYEQTGNNEEALNLLSRAASLRPEREDIRRLLIKMLLHHNQVNEARRQYHLLVSEIYKPLGMNIPLETLSLRPLLQLD
jgi:two-component SAPR family response regulator